MIYKSNAAEVIERIKTRLLTPAAQDKLLKTIAQGIYASNLRRIHNEGKNVHGTKIGKYSIKPMYVNPNNSPRKFSVKGKTGRTKFVSTGQPHKTRYFDTGYFGFRKQIGREASYVNFQLTGGLKANWHMQKSPNGLGYVIGFISSVYGKRAEDLEKKYGGVRYVWGITEEDRKNTKTIIKNWAHAGAK